MKRLTFAIAILGAGPAGTATALALKESGLRVALIDKSHFPRRKACGDALPGDTLKHLRKLVPGFEEELGGLKEKEEITSTGFFPRKGLPITLFWKNLAYNSSRQGFDNFLMTLVRKHTDAQIFESVHISQLEYDEEGYILLKNKDGSIFIRSRMVIGCDGSNSVVASSLVPPEMRPKREGTAITAYYENVTCKTGQNEMYPLKQRNHTGYFWIFPVGSNTYNIGFGLFGNEKVHYKKMLKEIIETDEIISSKFANARQVSDYKGSNLPFGGRKNCICGDNFMLAGDAAHLIDPLLGHGIDKAVESGMISAKHAIRCFNDQKFSIDNLKPYQEEIYQKIGKQLRRRYSILKLLAGRRWVLDLAVGLVRILNIRSALRGIW